jgi:hypothetical protein
MVVWLYGYIALWINGLRISIIIARKINAIFTYNDNNITI